MRMSGLSGVLIVGLIVAPWGAAPSSAAPSPTTTPNRASARTGVPQQTCGAAQRADPEAGSDLAAQIAAVRRAIAVADQAMAGGVFCSDLKAELDHWSLVSMAWGRAAAPQRKALDERRRRLAALIQAAQLDGQRGDGVAWRMTVPRAIGIAQRLIDGLDRGLRESTCSDPRTVGFALPAREILVGLGRPVLDAGEINLRATKLRFLCELVQRVTGQRTGKVDPAAIRADARRSLDELAAVPANAVTGEHRERFKRLEDMLRLLANAGDRRIQELDDERSKVADLLGVRPSMDRVMDQQRAAMRDLPPAMKQQLPNTQSLDFLPREATQRARPTVDALDCEASVLEAAGRMTDALARRDQAMASVHATEPVGSPILLEREITTADNLSARHGQHDEAARRMAAALTGFETAAHDRLTPALAQQLEAHYRKLAAVEDRAQHPDTVRRAKQSAARYHAQAKPLMDMLARYDVTGMMAAMAQFQALQDQVDAGDHDGARRALEQIDRIDVLQLVMLAGLESEAGNADAALAALVDATEGTERDLEQLQQMGAAAKAADQPMLPALVGEVGSLEAQAYHVARQTAAPDQARGLLFWLTELRKGRLFDAFTFGERVTTPDGARVLAELRQARAASAARYLAHVGERHAAPAVDERLRACTAPKLRAQPAPANQELDQIRRLEGQLLHRAPPHFPLVTYLAGGRPRAQYPRGTAAKFLADVTAALPAGSRFVGFSRVPDLGAAVMTSSPAAAPRAWTPNYVGFVVGPSGVVLVELGAAAEIDRLVAQAIAQVSSHPQSDRARPDTALLTAMQAVYDRLWRPLLPALEGAGHVFIAGDGALDALPFAALRDGGQWLFERYTLSYLHSARDLLVAKAPDLAGPAVVLADPVAPPAPSASSPLQPKLFAKLRYAEAEADAVHKLLPSSVVKLHADASEVALLSAAHPRILHVASHAAFLSDGPAAVPPAAASGSQRGAAIASAPPPPRSAQPDEGAEEGWMRSALVLSAPASVPGSKPVWDGFATAYEIMAMDLRGTELVTLSACQTGSGTVVGRHGTTSLQRAFLNAGAQSVLATLWRIDDRATPEWIHVFYDRLIAGHARERAVQEAMAETSARTPHPYYWAAFSLAGAVGPLRSH